MVIITISMQNYKFFPKKFEKWEILNFVSTLATRCKKKLVKKTSLREAKVKLESLTGYKLKVVERAGSRLEDVLKRSNPWRGEDCGREMCLL